MELLWACLLCLAAVDRRTRPLALLLAAKWAANYLAFDFVGQWSPPLIDVVAGAVGVYYAAQTRERWADIVIVGFIMTCLVHAWFWMLWDAGMATGLVPTQYYLAVIWIFTVMVAALAWPGGRSVVVRILDELDRRRLAYRTGHHRADHGESPADRGGRGGKGD